MYNIKCINCDKIIDDQVKPDILDEFKKESVTIKDDSKSILCKECQANNFILICGNCGAYAITNLLADGGILDQIDENGGITAETNGETITFTKDMLIHDLYGIRIDKCPGCGGNENEIQIAGIIRKQDVNNGIFK